MDLHHLQEVLLQAYHQAQPYAQQVVSILVNEPAHLIVEGVLLIFVLVLLCKRSYVIPKSHGVAPLTESEKDMLVKEWEPAPLIDDKQRRETVEANLGNEDGAPMLVVHSSAGPYVSLSENSKPDHLNLVTTGYLNLQDDKEVLTSAEKCLRQCGVGSCGPRGFYGTLDVHLDLEKKMAEFFGTPQSVLYSSGFATVSSVIPCFSKSNDYIFADKGISFPTQTGVTLARSKTTYFEHNNMAELEELCKKHQKVFDDAVHRVFVVIEGVYLNHADIAPLDEVLALKKKYPFRIICEESHSVGVLGRTGRGITEHFGLPTSTIEIICGSTGNALGTNGGFSVGQKEVTVHQRLSSSGYVFSCSLPPFVAAATITAFDRVSKGVEVQSLQSRVKDLAKALLQIKSLTVVHNGLTPIAHLRLPSSTGSRFQDDLLLQNIVDTVRVTKKVIVSRAHYVSSERSPPPPSIRITISSLHSAQDLLNAAKAIEEVAKKALSAAGLSASAASAPAALASSSSAKSNKLEIHDSDEDTEERVEPPTSPKRSSSSKKVPLSPKNSSKKITSPSNERKGKSSKSKKTK